MSVRQEEVRKKGLSRCLKLDIRRKEERRTKFFKSQTSFSLFRRGTPLQSPVHTRHLPSLPAFSIAAFILFISHCKVIHTDESKDEKHGGKSKIAFPSASRIFRPNEAPHPPPIVQRKSSRTVIDPSSRHLLLPIPRSPKKKQSSSQTYLFEDSPAHATRKATGDVESGDRVEWGMCC